MTKSPNNNSGFSTPFILILAALVVIGVGAVGVMVYHSHKATPAISSTVTNPAKQSKTKTPPKSPSQATTQTTATQYLGITQWGIKLPLSSAISDAYYVVSTGSQDSSGQPNTMWLGVTSLGGDCDATKANTSTSGITDIGALTRVAPTDRDPVTNSLYTQEDPNGVTIGNYYYAYVSGIQGKTCASTATLQSVDSAFATAAKNIVANSNDSSANN
jgi:hypothetical protein